MRLLQEEEEKKEAKKKKEKGKPDEKIAFDFEGNIVKVSNQSKPNLIHDSVKLNANKNLIKLKEASKDIESQPVQFKRDNKKEQQQKRPKKIDQIEFSSAKTLL